MATTTTAAIRAGLLASCDRIQARALERRSLGGREVREGTHAARQAIEKEPIHQDPLFWLDRVHDALEAVRRQLDDPSDDDGWALGGLASVRGEVENARAELLRGLPPDTPLTPTETLLRVATAARKAFPDRAESLLAEAEAWCHSGEPSCSLCGRGLNGYYAGGGLAPDRGEVSFVSTNSGSHAICICPRCAARPQADWGSNDYVLVDLLRALRAEDKDRNAVVCSTLERLFATRALRGVEMARCLSCGTVERAPVGKCAICFSCLQAANHAFTVQTDARAYQLGQDLSRSLEFAVAHRVVIPLEVAAEIDWLLQEQLPLGAEARADLLEQVGALVDAIHAGARILRRPTPPFDDRTEDFARLDRFRHPQLRRFAWELDLGPLVLHGRTAEWRRHAALLVLAWRDQQKGTADALWRVRDGDGSSSLGEVPAGSTLFIGDVFALDGGELKVLEAGLSEKPQWWRVMIGAQERLDFGAGTPDRFSAELAALLQARGFPLS